MSRAFICDRCGATFSKKPAEGPRYLPNAQRSAVSRVPVDLCDECTESLRRWFDDMDDKPGEDEA